MALLSYSVVPNKRAGSNKRAGRKSYKISINEQALISEQGGNLSNFNNRAGSNKRAGRNFHLFSQESREDLSTVPNIMGT